MRQRVSDIRTRLDDMNQSGTDLAVLSLNPPATQMYSDADLATSLAHDMNDALLAITKAHSQRFWGLGSVTPQQPEKAAEEVPRIMGQLGLVGVMINGHTNGRYLDDPSLSQSSPHWTAPPPGMATSGASRSGTACRFGWLELR